MNPRTSVSVSKYVYQTNQTGRLVFSSYTKAMQAVRKTPHSPSEFVPRKKMKATLVSPMITTFTYKNINIYRIVLR